MEELVALHKRADTEMRAALLIQKAMRRYLQQLSYRRKQRAIATLQRFYRRYYLGRSLVRRRQVGPSALPPLRPLSSGNRPGRLVPVFRLLLRIPDPRCLELRSPYPIEKPMEKVI